MTRPTDETWLMSAVHSDAVHPALNYTSDWSCYHAN